MSHIISQFHAPVCPGLADPHTPGGLRLNNGISFHEASSRPGFVSGLVVLCTEIVHESPTLWLLREHPGTGRGPKSLALRECQTGCDLALRKSVGSHP